jgi:ferredoxin-NADP reductase
MQVLFDRREELVSGIWQYYFTPEQRIDFVSGQYVDMVLNNVKTDARGAKRTFSLTSLPGDEQISFVTKHFGLQTSYKHTLQNLRPKDPAQITDAMGDLVLPKSTALPLVFVAGGIGIASYVSMLKDLLINKEIREIFLFYNLRNRREQLFRELLDSYPLSLKDVAIAPNLITAGYIRDSVPPNSLIYLSGGQQFVEKIRDDLESLGVPRSQIVFDYYDGYTEL